MAWNLLEKSAKKGEMLQIYPLHLSCENSKSSKKKLCQAHFGGLRNVAVGVLHWAAWGLGNQPASLGWCVYATSTLGAHGRRECPARCYMWMCKLQQMMHLAIMFFAYISRNNSSQTANILLNSHRMTMCHTVTQQGAWKWDEGMAQYEVSILEKHPSCSNEQQTRKASESPAAWLYTPLPWVWKWALEEIEGQKTRGPVAQRLPCLLQLCEFLKEPGNVAS